MLSLGRYALGVLELTLVVAAAWSGASAVRARLVPAWHGLVARIADAVLALAGITVVEQLVGTFGLLREWVVVLAVVSTGVTLRILLAVPTEQFRPARATRTRRWDSVAALVAVAVTVGQWADRIGGVLDGGITSFDSVHYHLPFAARFVDTASTAHVQLITPEFPDAYHHANAELLHALGMLFFHRDVLSLILNLGFVALAVAAAYCIGERWDEGPVAVIGLCVLLASPLMGLHHAGTATNDVVVLTFVLCAAALLLQRDAGVSAIALVGLAAGMAFGTKLTAVVIAAAFVLAVPLVAARGARAVAMAWAAIMAVLPAAYWLVRNWVDSGTPVPGVSLPFFPTARFQTLDDLGYSVAHYATSTDVWTDWFFPGLRIDLGRAWPVALAAVGVGAIGSVVVRDPRQRVLGAVALVGAVFYLVTPTTALGPDGQPLLFASNVRYASPALALGLTLVAALIRRRGVRAVVGTLLLGTLTISQFSAGAFPAWPRDHRVLGFTATMLFVVGALVLRRLPGGALAVAALALAVFAYPVLHRYDERRYRDDAISVWADTVHGARIAVAGFGPQFDLTGRDFSNRVQYVGERGAHGAFHEIESCTEWRHALRAGDYDYVVVAPLFPGAATHQVPWTASDPAASLVVSSGPRTVYRLDRTVADPGC